MVNHITYVDIASVDVIRLFIEDHSVVCVC